MLRPVPIYVEEGERPPESVADEPKLEHVPSPPQLDSVDHHGCSHTAAYHHHATSLLNHSHHSRVARNHPRPNPKGSSKRCPNTPPLGLQLLAAAALPMPPNAEVMLLLVSRVGISSKRIG